MPQQAPGPAPAKQSWTIGILCYNEAGTIENVVLQGLKVLKRIASDYEVLVIDDGSTDNSRDILTRLKKEHRQLTTVFHEKNKGIGGALRSMYGHARFENIGFAPGDGQFDLCEFLPVGNLEEGYFVSFYRKENTSYSLFRNVLSLMNQKVNRHLLGITVKDVNWTKVYKMADIRSLDLELESSLVESEICAKLLALGRKPIEIESRYLPRTYGVSKGSNWATVKKAMADVSVLVRVMRRFKKLR